MGRLADRVGPRAVIIAAMLAFSVLVGASGLATGLASLMVLRAMMGFADGAYTPPSIIATLEASPRGRITQLMREHEWNYGQTLTLPDINSMLTGSYDPPDLDQLTPDQLHDLERQWYLIAGHFRAQSAAE